MNNQVEGMSKSPLHSNTPMPFLTERQLLRFYKKIKKTDGCWEWLGYKSSDGYGKFFVTPKHITASRLSYFLCFKKDPGSLFVCHRCDNPSCVNPEHLFLGTKKDNRVDCENKGRAQNRKGSYNTNSKINEETVLKIRKEYLILDKTQKPINKLAKKYGLTYSGIYSIVMNMTWKHL